MTQTTNKFRAFITYSHTDKRVADWLHRTLEAYRLPSRLVGQQTGVGEVPAKLSPIFRDREELPAAGDLSIELCTALEQSSFLIVIASPAAAQSRWVNEEVRHYKQVHGDGRVLVLIVDGTPGSEDENECFPLAVRRRVDEKGQISDQIVEPIAADLRAEGDGKRLAKLKLVAGLTGLPLDKLVQREQVRRQRRLIVVAAVAASLALCMSVLALMAVRGQAEAEQQRAEADGLVEYMLTDLREQLEPVGRLEIFDSVGKRAMAYYANQDINELDADSLGRRARALHLVGEVRDLRADPEGASEAFVQAEETTAELLARDPLNESRIFDHAQSAYWVGYFAWQRNEMETAERRFIEYHRLASQLVEINPNKEEWFVELSSALVNLGVMLQDAGRFEEASNYFHQALKIDTEIANADLDDSEKQRSMAQDHAWLSEAMKGAWNFSAAMEERQKELSIYAGILAIDNQDARAREGKVVTYMDITDLHIIAGRYALALEASQSGLDEVEQLFKEDPSNSLWQDMVVSATNRHVEALKLVGNWEEAQRFNQLALQRAETLVKADPTIIYRKTGGLMMARWMEIAISFALHERVHARESITRFNRDFGTDPDLPRDLATIPWSMVYAMDALDRRTSGDIQAAEKLTEAIRELKPNQPREILVLQYLDDDSITPSWPANRAAQARNIGYDPALFLIFVKGT